MIQVSHMATAANRNVQENVDWQVPMEFRNEMQKIEEKRIEMLVFARHKIRIFRKVNASTELLQFLRSRKYMKIDWKYLIGEEISRNEEIRTKALREKILIQRLKYIEIDENIKINMMNKKFWTPKNRFCPICTSNYHRVFDCPYTFEKVLERMKLEKLTVVNTVNNRNDAKIEILESKKRCKKKQIGNKRYKCDFGKISRCVL
ncbi:hypothetical protein GVAV_000672 [Gurleya vavrai]